MRYHLLVYHSNRDRKDDSQDLLGFQTYGTPLYNNDKIKDINAKNWRRNMKDNL